MAITFCWWIFWATSLLLVYAFVIFPLLTFLLSFVTRRDEGTLVNQNELPSITLIIPAFNESTVIKAKLENSLSVAYPQNNLEIIVASDGSDDGTNEIAQAFSSDQIRVLAFKQRRGKATTVADAIDKSRAELLCLCDANVYFAPDAIMKMVSHFDDPSVGAVSGDVRLDSEQSSFGTGESFYYTLERRIQIGESQFASMMGVDGGMYLMRRQLYRTLPGDTILDDFAISMDILNQGYRIIYEPEAIANECATELASDEFRRRKRMAAGTVQIVTRRQFPSVFRTKLWFLFVSHKLLRWISPIILLTWFAVALIGAIIEWCMGHGTPFFATILFLQVLLLSLSVTGAVWPKLRNSRIVGLPFYFFMIQCAMLTGMTNGLTKPQKGTWDRTERGSEPTTR